MAAEFAAMAAVLGVEEAPVGAVVMAVFLPAAADGPGAAMAVFFACTAVAPASMMKSMVNVPAARSVSWLQLQL